MVQAVHSFHADAAKYSDKEVLLKYLTNLLHEYVSSNKSASIVTKQNDDFKESELEYNNIRRRVINKEPRSNEKDFDQDDDDEENIDEILSENDEVVIRPVKRSGTKRFWLVCKRITKIMCITKGKRYGNYLLALFVFVKILYTFNSVMQLFILNYFLGNDYLLLGVEVLSKVWNGDDWTQIKRFPRVTMCDFRIRVSFFDKLKIICKKIVNYFYI